MIIHSLYAILETATSMCSFAGSMLMILPLIIGAVFMYCDRTKFWVGELRVAWSGLLLAWQANTKERQTIPLCGRVAIALDTNY